MKRFVIPAAVLAATGLLITACGSTDTGHTMTAPPSPPATTGPSAPTTGPAAGHNDQDVMFAQMMIPHHRQAVEMARLAGDRAGGQVKELARRIEAAQDPEIRTMSGWLASWGVEAPGERTPADHMDHGMPGMMSDEDMRRLKGLKGSAFDKAFLTMMIRHHEGAIVMARQEQAGGAHEPAKRMAASIVTGQAAEIGTMKRLLR